MEHLPNPIARNNPFNRRSNSFPLLLEKIPKILEREATAYKIENRDY